MVTKALKLRGAPWSPCQLGCPIFQKNLNFTFLGKPSKKETKLRNFGHRPKRGERVIGEDKPFIKESYGHVIGGGGGGAAH